MIAQTYCGEAYKTKRDAHSYWCNPTDGPCPSCLRAHIARLEARNAELEAQAAAQAGGAVVPEPETSTLASLGAYSNPVDAVRATLRWARDNARALPASRALGEDK